MYNKSLIFNFLSIKMHAAQYFGSYKIIEQLILKFNWTSFWYVVFC